MKGTPYSILRNLHNEESGQDLIEYALVAALIAFGAVTAMQGLAGNIGSVFSKVGDELTSALA